MHCLRYPPPKNESLNYENHKVLKEFENLEHENLKSKLDQYSNDPDLPSKVPSEKSLEELLNSHEISAFMVSASCVSSKIEQFLHIQSFFSFKVLRSYL